MSERYERLFEGPNDLYAEDSPVLIKAHVLLRDNETGSVIAQIKFQNLTETDITFLKVRISAVDALTAPIEPSEYYIYNDVKAGAFETFGQNKPLPLPNASARSYTVAVVGVSQSDGTIWQNEDAVWHPDKEAADIAEKELAYKNAVEKKNAAVTADDYKAAAAEFAKLGDHREAAQAYEYCMYEARLCDAVEHRKESRKKKLLITAVILGALAVILVIWFVFAVPAINYGKACDLYNAGEYAKAAEAFDALGNYQDSTVMVKECKYQNANKNYNDEKYGAAFKGYKELGYYKESSKYALECIPHWLESIFEKAGGTASAKEFTAALKDFDGTYYCGDVHMYDVYKPIAKFIESHGDFDYWIDFNDYTYRSELMLTVLGVFPDTYKDVKDLKQVFSDITDSKMRTWNSDDYLADNTDLLKGLWYDYAFVRSYLQDDLVVYDFLIGDWRTTNGDYYLTFTEEDGSTHMQYNLPHTRPDGVKYYSIESMTVYLKDDEKHLATLYEITMTGYDSMSVYCIKDKKTYTLYRN